MDQILQDVETNRSDVGVLFLPAIVAVPLSKHVIGVIHFSAFEI